MRGVSWQGGCMLQSLQGQRYVQKRGCGWTNHSQSAGCDCHLTACLLLTLQAMCARWQNRPVHTACRCAAVAPHCASSGTLRQTGASAAHLMSHSHTLHSTPDAGWSSVQSFISTVRVPARTPRCHAGTWEGAKPGTPPLLAFSLTALTALSIYIRGRKHDAAAAA